MTKLPATLLWTEALHWMVYGEVGVFSDVKLTIKKCAAQLNGEPPPLRMKPEAAREALLDRLESGAPVATGRQCWAPVAGALKNESLPSEIPSSGWPAFLRIDDVTSFAEVKASIPAQGYADVTLKRADVLAAYQAATAANPDGAVKHAGGRPPLPYKEKVIEKVIALLEDEGLLPDAEIKKYMADVISQIDDEGGPSATHLAHGQWRQRLGFSATGRPACQKPSF